MSSFDTLALGTMVVSGIGWNEELGKTSHDVCRGSYFGTHFVGLPLHGSPLVFLTPPIAFERQFVFQTHRMGQSSVEPPSNNKPPISLWKGGEAVVRPRF